MNYLGAQSVIDACRNVGGTAIGTTGCSGTENIVKVAKDYSMIGISQQSATRVCTRDQLIELAKLVQNRLSIS